MFENLPTLRGTRFMDPISAGEQILRDGFTN